MLCTYYTSIEYNLRNSAATDALVVVFVIRSFIHSLKSAYLSTANSRKISHIVKLVLCYEQTNTMYMPVCLNSKLHFKLRNL